jgi:hypothetical protein
MKSFKNMASMVREEVSAPPMAARSLYTKMYAKHGGTASKAKEAQSKAYAEVEKKHGKQMRDSLEAYHKMNEETDTSEKIEMTQSQLHFIHYACEEILEFIDDGGEVEEWYQVKVAKAFSEFESLHSYMEGEARRTGMKEEVSKTADAPKMVRDRKTGEMYDPKKKFKELMDKPETKAVMNRLAKEEVEQIDELSKKTLGNYIKSATHDVAAKGAATRQFAIDSSRQSGEQDYDAARKSMAKSDKTFSKSWKRRDNMAKAVDRLTKEEIEQIDEISKETMGSYIKKASKDIENKKQTQSFDRQMAMRYYGPRGAEQRQQKKIDKRHSGISTAVDRLTKEEIEQIDEKNVPTSPEKWAQAKSQAKAKFDVYPSAYANGWAAKKYKEMGGGWKSVNEEKNDAPFEGGKPVSSKKSVVPGKYGAGFSTAKHLAKTAMKKQSDKMKKPVKEEASPKVKIVKDIMKKKKQESADTFQKDPIISKSEVRM